MKEYTPFKMKAADYGNSPMLMNFPDAFPGGVGSSPAQFGFFKRVAKKVKKLGKKVLGQSLVGKALGLGKDKKDPTNVAAADANAVIQPHTHDETGAIVPEGQEVQADVATPEETPMDRKKRAIEIAKKTNIMGGKSLHEKKFGRFA